MPQALLFLVLTFAGWLNRRQEDLIDYLREENRVLRELLGSQPLQLTDAQRRRLAVRGRKLGRRALTQVAGIVTPDTILRWYRRLIAKKYDGSARRRRGRPMTPRKIAELVVRMAVEHYHGERNHQGLDNQLLERAPPPGNPDGEVHRRERIGGLLNYYHREAA